MNDDDADSDEAHRAVHVLATLEALQGSLCQRFQGSLCGHELTMSLALGFKSSPICLPCFAHKLNVSPEQMREDIYQRVTHRDCFLQGWLKSSEMEGYAAERRPPCLWPEDSPEPENTRPQFSPAPNVAPEEPVSAATWDAGDMSCGDLVLELRNRLYSLESGAVLHLTATDKAAPEDIPAWCRVTRNSLIQFNHPHYWIRRKDS